ncbi:hypothetical protein SDC9_166141 [bioreactor metagenome]|uniref:Uncharacterized protein n=1 Tax=bioreactor metagenome TaxID=1076179 RepID=A0A645FW79_9ZZZZ
MRNTLGVPPGQRIARVQRIADGEHDLNEHVLHLIMLLANGLLEFTFLFALLAQKRRNILTADEEGTGLPVDQFEIDAFHNSAGQLLKRAVAALFSANREQILVHLLQRLNRIRKQTRKTADVRRLGYLLGRLDDVGFLSG